MPPAARPMRMMPAPAKRPNPLGDHWLRTVKVRAARKAPGHRADRPDGHEQHEDDAVEEVEVGDADDLLDGAVEGSGQPGHAGGNGEHGDLGRSDVEADGGIGGG